MTSRGDRCEAIYLNDADRRAWLETFDPICGRFNWVCHTWCQMTNHYHMVVETVEGNLSLGMRRLNGVYTQCINRSHQCVGHVFQRRYKGILVEKDSYLLALARSVVSNLVLNPLRAGRVRDTAAWPWRSYHAMTGNRRLRNGRLHDAGNRRLLRCALYDGEPGGETWGFSVED